MGANAASRRNRSTTPARSAASRLSNPLIDAVRIEALAADEVRERLVVGTDVTVGGMSMKVALRDQFASWIESNGRRFGALLTVLRQQIARAL
jgi:hypothetical protein